MRLEVDPARFKRLCPVIGQTDGLAVPKQSKVSWVKHGLALLPEFPFFLGVGLPGVGTRPDQDHRLIGGDAARADPAGLG